MPDGGDSHSSSNGLEAVKVWQVGEEGGREGGREEWKGEREGGRELN